MRHAGRLVFQLAEVLVSREMLGGILERIGRLRLAPGRLALPEAMKHWSLTSL